MTDNKEKEALIDRIRKLMEKSESAHKLGNKAEAEAFAKGAQNMMLKYQLETEDIRKAQGGKIKMKLEIWNWMDLTNRHEANWAQKLIQSLATGNLCYVVNTSSNGSYARDNPDYEWRKGDMAIMGQPENIEMTRYMLDQLNVKARLYAKESFKAYKGDEKRNTYIRGFLSGFSMGIGQKLSENLASYTQASESETSLMIISQALVVRKFVETKFRNLNSGKAGHSLSGANGHSAGVQQGRNTSIHRGINSSGQSTTTKRLG